MYLSVRYFVIVLVTKLLFCSVLVASILLNTQALAQSTETVSAEETRLVAIMLAEQILELVPTSADGKLMRDDEELSVAIIGIKNSTENFMVEDEFTTALATKNAEKLVDLILDYNLQLDMDNSTDTILAFKSITYESPEGRLYELVKNNALDEVEDLLSTESPDMEYLTDEGIAPVTALAVATRNNNTDMVKLLLEHGANPDNYSKEMIAHPMSLALNLHGNLEIARVFIEAGVSPDMRAGIINRDPLPMWAVRHDSIDFMKYLVSKGADPSVSGVHGWTALSDAIVLGQTEMIDYLIDFSNPLKRTWAERRSSRTSDYPWFPASNALFLARHFGDAGVENIEQRLLDRAVAWGGESSDQVLHLQAVASASGLAYAQGDLNGAITELESALGDIDVSTLEPTASADYIGTASDMLADLHEMKLIEGTDFDGEFRELADLITNMGGRWGGAHAMLDVLADAKTGYPEESIAVWQREFVPYDLKDWNFHALAAWVEENFDGDIRAQLHNTLDAFELPKLKVK
jgi:hypothetical protein